MSKLSNIVTTGESLVELTKCGVYQIYHIKKPNHNYVGSASGTQGEKKCNLGFYKRFLEHMRSLEKGSHSSRFLQNVVNKHGIKGVRFRIIEIVESKDRDEIINLEQYYINTTKPKYNTSKTARCPTVPYTDERRKAASDRMKGKCLKHLHKKNRIKIDQLTKEGKYIKTFSSITEAATSVNVSHSHISRCASGLKPSAGGFKWRRIQKNI